MNDDKPSSAGPARPGSNKGKLTGTKPPLRPVLGREPNGGKPQIEKPSGRSSARPGAALRGRDRRSIARCAVAGGGIGSHPGADCVERRHHAATW
ncbi:MAG: hypothetical protein WAN86_02560 [Hyphomicrobiaceae bacterium]